MPRPALPLKRKRGVQVERGGAAARRGIATELVRLRPPIAGVVTRMSAVLGATADQSQPLVEVADPAALDIVFSVSPAEAARIHAGEAVTLTAGDAASGEALGRGVVTAVAVAVDTASRAVPVHARVERVARPLRIGESVVGTIVTAVTPRAVTVPVAALVPTAGGESFQVFVVDSEQIAHVRSVTVAGRSETVAEITFRLHAGEVVVTK